MNARRCGSSLSVLLLLAAAACGPATSDPRTPKQEMVALATALRRVLPASLDPALFGAPERHDELVAALADLRRGGDALEAHGQSADAGFRNLARELAREVREIDARFHEGRTEEARFLVGELSAACIACHSRLPSEKDSELGQTLFESVATTPLASAQRMRFAIATRQFDLAQADFEALLASPDFAREPDAEALFADYLTVAIRVRGDLARPRAALAGWKGREAAPSDLVSLVDAWTRALAEQVAAPALGDELARARALVGDSADRETRAIPGRRRLVEQLLASSLLHRHVRALEPAQVEPEAYLLLGLAELGVRRAYWLSEPESYFEAAIRGAPASDVARAAYRRLEQETVAGYTGSGGENVPPEVQRWLDELKALVEG